MLVSHSMQARVSRLAIAAAISIGAASVAFHATLAQTTHRAAVTTDPRWTPWLGCWESDTTGAGAASVSVPVTCIVPVSNASSVDALSIAGGQIVSRRPLIADGKSHPMDESGCHGDETANWSPTSRRIYLHATYLCAAGLRGTSSSVFTIAPNGDWLQVQTVRAGGGSIDRILRWHETSPPRGLPASVASSLVSQRLAVATARAAVARPLTLDDVIEAAHAVDTAAVRNWLVATGQRFALDATQLAALDRADVPPSIVRIMAGADQATAAANEAERRRVDDYLRGYPLPDDAYGAVTTLPANPYSSYNGYGTYVPYTPYPSYPTYPTYGYDGYGYGYGAYDGYGYGGVSVGYPVVVVHNGNRGGNRDGRHDGNHGGSRDHPVGIGHTTPAGPVGRQPTMHVPANRPIGAIPPVSRPPVVRMPVTRAPASHAPEARKPLVAAPPRTRP
jgi:hypothetical protein